MKNVTITLPEDLAAWLRAEAARNGRSMSRWLREKLDEMRRPDATDDTYDAAMRWYLNRPAVARKWVGGRKPTREELHDRAGLR